MKASISYKEYRESDAISPSDIKLFGRDINAFYKGKILKQPVEERTSNALVIGDIADMILTQPKDIDKLYYIVTDLKATEKIKDIVDIVFTKRTEEIEKGRDSLGYLQLDHPEISPLLEDAITEVGYYNSTWTMQKRLATIIDKGSSYYEQRQEMKGRKQVNIKIYNKAVQAVERARLNNHMQEYIQAIEGIVLPPYTVIKKQVAVYGAWEGIRIKGLIDVLWINMMHKLLKPIEIKTCKVLQMFLRSAKMRRYDVQVDMYHYLLEQIVKDPNSPYYGFTVEPTMIMALPIEGEQQPEWFEFTDKDYQIARYGHDEGPGRHIYGWTEALTDIQWHVQNNKWEHHKAYYDNNLLNSVDLWGSNIEIPDESMEDEDLFNL